MRWAKLLLLWLMSNSNASVCTFRRRKCPTKVHRTWTYRFLWVSLSGSNSCLHCPNGSDFWHAGSLLNELIDRFGGGHHAQIDGGIPLLALRKLATIHTMLAFLKHHHLRCDEASTLPRSFNSTTYWLLWSHNIASRCLGTWRHWCFQSLWGE